MNDSIHVFLRTPPTVVLFLILHVSSVLLAYPIGSMYAIYGNIYHQYTPNVSIYTIHGSYGYVFAVQAGHQHDVSLRSALLRGLGSGGKRSALKNSQKGRPREGSYWYFDFPVYKWEIYKNIWKYMEIWWNIWKYDEIWWNMMKYDEIYGNMMKYDEIWWNMWLIDLLTSEISGPRLVWSQCGG